MLRVHFSTRFSEQSPHRKRFGCHHPVRHCEHIAAGCASSDSSQHGRCLSDFRIVLVSPKIPANIGAAARLVENFEASSLYLVTPRCDPFGEEAQSVSVNSPALDKVTIVSKVSDAVRDCSTAIAFTRRTGAGRIVHPSLSRFLESYPDTLTKSGGDQCALVFGREESGLSEAEIHECSHSCSIPTGSALPSMNVSHSVAVVLSQLFETRKRNGGLEEAPPSLLNPATIDEIDALVRRVHSFMNTRLDLDVRESAGGANSGRRIMMAGKIRRVLRRSRISSDEVKALFGLIKELEKKLVD